MITPVIPTLFNPGYCKATYHCESFYIDTNLGGVVAAQQTAFWFGLFSHQRDSFRWKGIVELNLSDQLVDQDADAELLRRGWKMPKKLTRDALVSQFSAIDALLVNAPEHDLIGRASLNYRRREVSDEIDQLDKAPDSLGSVVLAFEGGPVIGSRGVDAEFAADALRSYQDLVANQMMAAETGGLAQRGPVPDKSSTRLNITNVVHGSFGFQLEENGGDQPQFIDSALKKSIIDVDTIIRDFASRSDESYIGALEKVDRRVFISLQKFFENLYADSASLKIIESERNITIDNNAVVLARTRVKGVSVDDVTIRVEGWLLGLTPVSRRFDLQPEQGTSVISGQVGQRLSDDYLERLRGDQRLTGRLYRASLNKRTTTRADGSTSQSYTLLSLEQPTKMIE